MTSKSTPDTNEALESAQRTIVYQGGVTGAEWIRLDELKIDHGKNDRQDGPGDAAWDEETERLRNLIETEGLIDLPQVRTLAKGKYPYELVHGFRRVTAMSRMIDPDLPEGENAVQYVPVRIVDLDNVQVRRLRLMMNTSQRNLSVAEKIESVAALAKDKVSVEEICTLAGIPETRIKDYILVNDLISEWKKLLREYRGKQDKGVFTFESAVLMMKHTNVQAKPDKQKVMLDLWQEAIEHGHQWSQRSFRSALDDPEAFREKLLKHGGSAVNLSGPEAISGVVLESPMTLALNTTDCGSKPTEIFDFNIAAADDEVEARLELIDDEVLQKLLKDPVYGPVVNAVTDFMVAKVARDTMANLYNLMLTRKAIAMRGTEALPRENTAKAGDNVLLLNQPEPEEPEAPAQEPVEEPVADAKPKTKSRSRAKSNSASKTTRTRRKPAAKADPEPTDEPVEEPADEPQAEPTSRPEPPASDIPGTPVKGRPARAFRGRGGK